jgi:hypothetical protein
MRCSVSAASPVASPDTQKMDCAGRVWCGVINPEHASKPSFSLGNGDAVPVGCPFWSPA